MAGTSSKQKHAPPLLTHVGSGKYSDVFKITQALSKPVIMKISYYRDDTLCNVIKRTKKGDLKGALRAKRQDAIQVGVQFARLTTALVESVSPHFVVVYCDEDCTSYAPRLGPLLKDRLKELSPLQKRYNNVCFMEVFHDDMTKFLTRRAYTEDSLRAMIFQVVYTLAALQKRLPGFRHNDLSTNNVLVKKLRHRPLLSYTFDGVTYYVSNNILPALSDYDFTNVPNHPELTNERVYSGKYKVDGKRNDSYDTHFFLKSVLKCIHRRAEAFPATMDFIRRQRLKEEDRQNGSVFPRLAPRTLLRDPYFRPLQTKPPGKVGAAYAA